MENNKEKKDIHPIHKPPVVYNSEQWLREKEERRKAADKMRKKEGNFEPIIETISGEFKKASKLTYEERQMEIIRCTGDPIYFIETYLTIFDQTQGEIVNGKPVGKIVPFKLFFFQRDLIKEFLDNRYVITNKYRQAGITTATSAYVSWYIMFNENRSVALVADKLETARDEVMHDVVTFIDSCPSWLKPKTGKAASNDKTKYKDTQRLKRYDNGSSIAAFSSKGLRGYTPTLIFWDEVAWTEKSDKFWTSAGPTLQTGGSAIMVSCVTKDSFVFTNNGIKTIGDFIDEDKVGGYYTDQYSILGKDKLRTSNIVFNNGYVDTLRIKTMYSEIETSYNHKFWAYKNGEYNWFKAEELNINDYVSIQKGMNVWGNNDDCDQFKPTISNKIKNKFNPKKITPNIAYLLGLYISEGYCYEVIKRNKIVGYSLTITCGDSIDHVFKDLGLNYYSDGIHYTVSSKNIGEFLKYLGFDITKKAKEKTIPPKLLEMSKKNIIALIQGIMDGDGWASFYEKKNKIRVGIGLSSKRLIQQLRIIFNNFGILTEYSEHLTPKTKKVNVTSLNYRICANNGYALKYFNEIGFRFKRKSDIINKYKPKNLKHCGVKDNIPNGLDLINRIYGEIKEHGKLRELKNHGIKIRPTKNDKTNTPYSRKTLLKLIECEKENIPPDLLTEVNSYLNENIVWVKIKEIDKSKNHTYDFSLPSNPKEINEFNHSVVYNQMITHQTPNGLDETFYKIFDGAKKGDNEFKAVELWWFNDPRYNEGLEWVKNKGKESEIKIPDENWSNEQRIKLYNDGWYPTSPWFEKEVRNANGDMRKIAQEILCVFGDAKITVRHKKTKKIETITISEFYRKLNE